MFFLPLNLEGFSRCWERTRGWSRVLIVENTLEKGKLLSRFLKVSQCFADENVNTFHPACPRPAAGGICVSLLSAGSPSLCARPPPADFCIFPLLCFPWRESSPQLGCWAGLWAPPGPPHAHVPCLPHQDCDRGGRHN